LPEFAHGILNTVHVILLNYMDIKNFSAFFFKDSTYHNRKVNYNKSLRGIRMLKPGKNLTFHLFTTIMAIIVFGLMVVFAISIETPLGSVSGKVVSAENKSIITDAKVYHPKKNAYVKTDEFGRYVLHGVPAGKQKIHVQARGFHNSFNSSVVVEEGKTTQNIDFSLIRRKSTYDIFAYQKVFSPVETPQINIRGYLVKKIKISVYKVNPEEHRHLFLEPKDIPKINTGKMKPVFEEIVANTFNDDGEFDRTYSIPLEQKGLYVVKSKAVNGRMEKSTWVVKSDIGLVVKRSPDELLVYAQSFTTGKPVEGVNIRVRPRDYNDFSGVTDKNGIFSRKHSGRGTIRIAGSKGEDIALADSYFYSSPDRYRIYMYTERPVYRPGQDVFFKGIVRMRDFNRYKTNPGTGINITVTDTQGNEIYNNKLETNQFGTFNSSFQLDGNAPLGTYFIMAGIGEEREFYSFEVSEYRKPEYKIEVTTDKPHYVARDRIHVKVKGTYYFGAPVTNAEYRLVVYESPYYWYGMGWYDFMFSGNRGHGGIMYESSGVLNEKGEAEVVIQTGKIDHSKQLEIEAELTDISGRAVTGTLYTTLATGEFALYAYSDSYLVQPGNVVNINVEAMDFDHKPIRDRKITVQPKRMEYVEKEVPGSSAASSSRGNYREYRTEVVEKRVGQAVTVTTDEKGQAVFQFTPEESGGYSFELRAEDDRRNVITYETYMYASAAGNGRAMSDADLKIITDKKQYNPGDTLKAVISSTKPDTYVLLTIEGKKIHDKRVIHIEEGSMTLDIPLGNDYFPNVFLTATTIRDMHLISDTAEIKFNRNEKALDIKIEPDKERYYPGEKAKYTITVTDDEGKPVVAELSLGVVDEAIYAIQPDNTPNIHEFFWSYDYNHVETNYSFARDYSGGADKDRPQKIRKDFRDTASWSPTVVTDKNGKAVVEFTMPDNLTTWVGTVRCADMNTRVGSSVNFTLCTKDLLVRLETPRFLTQKDRLKIGGVVHNYTDKDQKIRVWLEAEGVKLIDVDRIHAEIKSGEAADFYWEVIADEPGIAKFTLLCMGEGAEDAMELELPVHPYSVEEIRAETGVIDQNSTKANIELDLPENVIEKATSMEILLSPSLAATVMENLDYLVTYPYGCVEQTMSSFIPAVVVQRVFSELEIPMKDQEFADKIPDVVRNGLSRLYNLQKLDGGWGWWSNDPSQPVMTAYVVMGLSEARRNGYHVSQRVLENGIKYLKKAVKDPAKPVKTVSGIYQEGEQWNTQAYLLYSLYRAGHGEPARTVEAFNKRDKMNEYALAMLAMTLNGVGEAQKAGIVMNELNRKALIDHNRCYWKGRTFTYSWMDNSIETTAYCLLAYLELRPGEPKIHQTIRWLTSQRIGSRYNSTKDTAAVVMAFARYLEESGELKPEFNLVMNVNDKQHLDAEVDSPYPDEKIGRITLNHSNILTGKNTVDLDKQGQGYLYYTARLRYYPEYETIPAVNQGITINRKYELLTMGKDRNGHPAEITSPLPDRPLKRGERLRVTITVNPERDYRYVIIEDPLPAGFETMIPEYRKNWGSLWWCQQEVRDEKVSFFANRLQKDEEFTLTYDIRSEMFGDIGVLPAQVYCMYSPEIRGHSNSSRLVVE
jgi:alpha-2-macroglobulin